MSNINVYIEDPGVTAYINDAGEITVDFGNVINTETEFSIATKTEKLIPIDDDIVLIADSEDSYNHKKVKIGNILNGGTFT